MLRSLRQGIVAWIGTFLAALAVASFAAPTIAVAFAPTPEAIHCLAQPMHEDGPLHSHSAQSGHEHDGDHGRKGTKSGHETTCCGMFNMTALAAADLAPLVLSYWGEPDISTLVEPGFYPHAPEQPTRPPNTRLPH